MIVSKSLLVTLLALGPAAISLAHHARQGDCNPSFPVGQQGCPRDRVCLDDNTWV